MSIDIANIDKLSDEELFKALKESGLNVGPITATTRSLYERRLKNFLEGNSSKAAPDTTMTTTTTTESPAPSSSPKPSSASPATPKRSPSPKKTQPSVEKSSSSSSSRNVSEILSSSSYASNDSPSSDYLRIRGRAPMNRTASQYDQTNSDSTKKSSSFSSLFKYLLIIIFAAVVYFVLLSYQREIKQVTSSSDFAN